MKLPLLCSRKGKKQENDKSNPAAAVIQVEYQSSPIASPQFLVRNFKVGLRNSRISTQDKQFRLHAE